MLNHFTQYIRYLAVFLAACSPQVSEKSHSTPSRGPPVTSNETPYSVCLKRLAQYPRKNRPTLTVGDIRDKTGKYAFDLTNDSTELTQGVSEMAISAFYKTGQVNIAERLDARIPLAEQQMIAQQLINAPASRMEAAPAHFIVLGALTELNYNIHSGGERLYIGGIGGSRRSAVINVAADLRLVDMRTLRTVYVTSLQKQIVGVEQEAGIFRFFDNQLVEFDSGSVRNEPLQLGVRSVMELGAYQILTEGLGLPARNFPGCAPGEDYPEPAALPPNAKRNPQ